jgi:hypothetical protein
MPPADPPAEPATPDSSPVTAPEVTPLPGAPEPAPAAPAPRPGAAAPPAARPAARVTRLAVHRTRGRWVAAFRLSTRARVRVDLRRGGHVVRPARATSLATGAHRVRVGHLRPGRYRLRVTAVARGGRATVRTVHFRVARRAG